MIVSRGNPTGNIFNAVLHPRGLNEANLVKFFKRRDKKVDGLKEGAFAILRRTIHTPLIIHYNTLVCQFT